MPILRQTLTSFIAVLFSTTIAGAVSVPWNNPSGEIPGVVRWSNGQTDNGLFGSPVVDGATFRIPLNNFRATATPGAPQTTTDRLFVQFDLLGASSLPAVQLDFAGQYNANSGTVSAEAFLFVTNLDQQVGVSNPLAQQASTSPAFPIVVPTNMSQGGPWEAHLAQDIPTDWRRITVVLNMTLQASAGAGGSADIQIDTPHIEFRFDVPEPTMLIAAPFMFLFRRRSCP